MKWITRIVYGAGQMQKDLVASALNIFSILYLENCINIGRVQVGSLLLSGQIVNAISTPLIGMLSDYATSAKHKADPNRSYLSHKPSVAKRVIGYFNLRNRKAWHLYGSALMTIGLPTLFGQSIEFVSLSIWVKLIVLGLSLALLQVGWAAVQISHLTLINYLTSDASERVLLVSMRYVFASIADISSFTISYLLMKPDTQPDNQTEQSVNSSLQHETNSTEMTKFSAADMPFFRNITLLMTVYGVLFVVAFQLVVPEKGDRTKTAQTEDAAMNNAVPGDSRMKSPCHLSQLTIGSLPALVTNPDEFHSIASQLNAIGINNSALWGTACKLEPNNDDAQMETSVHTEPEIVQPFKWYSWFRRPRFWIACFIFTTVRMNVTIAVVYLSPLLIKDLKLDKSSIVLMPLGIYITSLLASLIQHRVAKYLGKMGNLIIGVFFTWCYCAIIFFCNPDNMHQALIYSAAVLLGVGNAFCNVFAIVVVSDLIGHTQTETAAFVHGFASLLDKIFTGMGIQLIQIAIPRLSYKDVETYIVGGMASIGGLLSAIDYFYMRRRLKQIERKQYMEALNSSEPRLLEDVREA